MAEPQWDNLPASVAGRCKLGKGFALWREQTGYWRLIAPSSGHRHLRSKPTTPVIVRKHGLFP